MFIVNVNDTVNIHINMMLIFYWLALSLSKHKSQCNVDEKESLNRCGLIGALIHTCTVHECATLQRVQLYRLPSAVEIVVRAVTFDGKVLDALEVRRVGAGPASNATKLVATACMGGSELFGICDKAHQFVT